MNRVYGAVAWQHVDQIRYIAVLDMGLCSRADMVRTVDNAYIQFFISLFKLTAIRSS
jgi:hypothetical protein